MNPNIAMAVKERDRRLETRQAILDVVELDGDASFTIAALRRCLAVYYGADIADGATVADLSGGACAAGAFPAHGEFLGARLRKPARAALRRVANKWEKRLPAPELPLIRRRVSVSRADEEGPHYDEIEGASIPPGACINVHGKWYQNSDPATLHAWSTGGGQRRGGPQHRTKRRFPGYVAMLRALLDSAFPVSAVDRQICEFVIEGRTIRWIADELGMKRPTVHKRVKLLRDRANIPGPGSGR